MILQDRPALTPPLMISPLVVAGAFIALCGLLREPARQKFSAIFVAGAGAAYLGGGLGPWELAFCTLMTFIAYKGLQDYRFIGAGWVLHTCWDVVHHLYGNPIIPFLPMSSAGCAICDLGLAAWYFAGAPSPWPHVRRLDQVIAGSTAQQAKAARADPEVVAMARKVTEA